MVLVPVGLSRMKSARGHPSEELSAMEQGRSERLSGSPASLSSKNQAIPAYDPRAVKGMAITYATTPMGGDHTAGYAVTANILGVGGNVDPLGKDGQIELSRNLQIATAAIDSTGMCLFVAFAALDDAECLPALIDLINARYGINLTGDDVTNLGKSILKTERAFNQAAGLNNADDRLPEFFYSEPLPPHNTVVDFTPEEIDSFWNF